MNNETRSSESGTTDTRGPSRRTLVRTAAWSVPVISTVAAAPAFAAASDTVAITAASGTWTVLNNLDDYVSASVTIQNSSTSDVTNNLLVTMTFPNVYVWGPSRATITIQDRTISFSGVTAGWGSPTVSYLGSGFARTATVVFSGPQIPAGTSAVLQFRVTTTRDVGNNNLSNVVNNIDTISPITMSASAANGTPFVVAGLTALNPTA